MAHIPVVGSPVVGGPAVGNRAAPAVVRIPVVGGRTESAAFGFVHGSLVPAVVCSYTGAAIVLHFEAIPQFRYQNRWVLTS